MTPEATADATAADRPAPEGLAVVDKPAGWTSHDVVAKVRGILRTKKVGHSGTLDPGATGVLVLGVGRATRVLPYVTSLPKRYEGELVLGAETTTLDDEGEVTATFDMSDVTADQVRREASRFVGAIEQVPPMVSAVKVGGRRLHQIAREGGEVERRPRPVTVHALEVEPTADPAVYRLAVECSSGTYIRVLAADIGQALGGGAHLRALRRTAIGSFVLDEATTVEDVSLVPASILVRDHPSIVVDADVATDVGYGKVLTPDRLGVTGAGPWLVLDRSDSLLAVYAPHREGTVKPLLVLTAG